MRDVGDAITQLRQALEDCAVAMGDAIRDARDEDDEDDDDFAGLLMRWLRGVDVKKVGGSPRAELTDVQKIPPLLMNATSYDKLRSAAGGRASVLPLEVRAELAEVIVAVVYRALGVSTAAGATVATGRVGPQAAAVTPPPTGTEAGKTEEVEEAARREVAKEAEVAAARSKEPTPGEPRPVPRKRSGSTAHEGLDQGPTPTSS